MEDAIFENLLQHYATTKPNNLKGKNLTFIKEFENNQIVITVKLLFNLEILV